MITSIKTLRPPKGVKANHHLGEQSYPTWFWNFSRSTGKAPKQQIWNWNLGSFVSIFRPLPTIYFHPFPSNSNLNIDNYMLFPFASWETHCNLPQLWIAFFCANNFWVGFRPRSLGDPVRALAVERWFFGRCGTMSWCLSLHFFLERRSLSRPEFIWLFFVETAYAQIHSNAIDAKSLHFDAVELDCVLRWVNTLMWNPVKTSKVDGSWWLFLQCQARHFRNFCSERCQGISFMLECFFAFCLALACCNFWIHSTRCGYARVMYRGSGLPPLSHLPSKSLWRKMLFLLCPWKDNAHNMILRRPTASLDLDTGWHRLCRKDPLNL